MSWLADYFGAEGVAAIRLSIWVSFWATVISLPFAIFIAHLLARRHFPGKLLLDVLVHLPLLMPPVVTGYLLLLTFGRTAPIGTFLEDNFGLVLAFRWTGATLAAAVMGFPLMVRAIRLAFEAVDTGLEEAAATLGATPTYVFTSITLPLIAPGILAGTVLGFAKAMGEFGATITFVSNIPGETQTLPSAVYAFLQVPGGEDKAIHLVFAAIVIATLALLASELLARRWKTASNLR